jgi:hypothetical protein
MGRIERQLAEVTAQVDAVAAWEARAEREVGVMIARYLAENPAPGRSHVEDDLARWSGELRSDGQARLAALGHPSLRAVGR